MVLYNSVKFIYLFYKNIERASFVSVLNWTTEILFDMLKIQFIIKLQVVIPQKNQMENTRIDNFQHQILVLMISVLIFQYQVQLLAKSWHEYFLNFSY